MEETLYEKPSKIRKIANNCVKLILHDFIINQSSEDVSSNPAMMMIHEKLKCPRKTTAFQPCLVDDSIKYKTCLNCNFTFPCDVKISYRTQLIIVTDAENRRIVFFNLDTLEYINALVTPGLNPFYLLVEEEENSDNLFVSGSTDAIMKMKLNHVNSNLPLAQILWFSQKMFKDPQGLAIRYGKEGNFIYVCDRFNDRIVIMQASDGTLVKTISSIKVFHPLTLEIEINSMFEPFAITMDENRGTILIGFKKSLLLVSEDESDSFTLLKTLNADANNHSHLLLDKESRNVLIGDEGNHRISVLNIDSGLVVKSFGKFGKDDPYSFDFITGFCSDRRNGSVFISDCENHQIKVFVRDELK